MNTLLILLVAALCIVTEINGQSRMLQGKKGKGGNGGKYPVPAPTLPPVCAVTLCMNPCSVECTGCSAPNVQCEVVPCADSVCCGCAKYTINGRDVTEECKQPERACRCAAGDTYCCDGVEYGSLCEATCTTCYDIDADCKLGSCP